MKQTIAVFIFGLFLATNAIGQSNVLGEVLSGKLIKPEVGVFAWYDLKDNVEDKKFRLRLAIVGKEQVRRKTGYWFETQIIPEVGFPAVYKLLLTGPASDPKNVHRTIYQEGQRDPIEVEMQEDTESDNKSETPKTERKSLGEESINLPEGSIKAEHFQLSDEDSEIWINEEVRPMGLVRFKSPQGELKLLRYGKGGADGKSVLNVFNSSGEDVDVEVAPAESVGGRIHVEVNEENEADEETRNRVNEILERRRRR